MLHVVYYVGDLDKTIKCYTECLGMKLLRRRDIPEDKYRNAFLGYGPTVSQSFSYPQSCGNSSSLSVVHTPYTDYGVDKYEIGSYQGEGAISYSLTTITDALSRGFHAHCMSLIYLTREFQMGAVAASTIISLWSATSSFLAIFGAFLSDSLLGRFTVILIGSSFSLLGTTGLWSTAMLPELRPPPCESVSCVTAATPTQLAILYASLGLVSLGSGCLMPCSMAFGADQLDKKDNPNNERVLQGFFNWYYAFSGAATLLGLTVVVYVQDTYGWQVGLAVPAFLVLFSTLLFLLPSSIYVKHQARGGLFLGCFRVLVATICKTSYCCNVKDEHGATRGLVEHLDVDTRHRYYFQGLINDNNNNLISPTPNLRWLNKACLILNPETDINPHDGSAKNPWTLCTVEEVEAVKSIARVLPVWSTSFLFHLTHIQTPFMILQAQTMNRHIFSNSFEFPPGSLNTFTLITFTLSIILYDSVLVPILSKLTGNPRGLTTNVRLGAGMILAISAMTISGAVEAARRRNAAREEDMISVLWLVPALLLFGMAQTLNSIEQIAFYYSQLPKAMSSIAMSLFTLGAALGSLLSSVLIDAVDRFSSGGGKESWLCTNLNEGRLDYYYWLIAGICSANFVYFLLCCRTFT